MNEIQMPHHLPGRCGGRGHQIVLRANSGTGAIIHNVTVFTQHQPIAHPVLFQTGKRVGVKQIQKSSRIRALDINFSQGRDIANANCPAHHLHLAITGLPPMGLTFEREIARPIPQPRLNHRRAAVFADLVRGQKPLWRKAFAMSTCAKGGQGDGHIGRTEGGRARFRYASTGGIGQNRKRGSIGVFALISGHALGGVAFHMLDRAKIFLNGLFDIFDRHIILKIKPRPPGAADIPKRGDLIGRVLHNRQRAWLDPFPQRPGQSQGLCLPLRQSALRAHLPCGSARRHQARNGARLGGETCQSRIPNRAAVHVTG